MAPQRLGKDSNTQFDRVRLHDHNRGFPGLTRQDIGIVLEQCEVVPSKPCPVCVFAGIAAQCAPGQHHHKVGSNLLGIENDIDCWGVVAERIAEISSQRPKADLAAAAPVSHQLQQAFRRNQMAIQKLNSQLTAAMTGGADDGQSHAGRRRAFHVALTPHP